MSQDRLTKLARGMPCQVRLEGICNGRTDTTVPAHYPLAGVSGRGIKSPSTCIAWACLCCHDVCDGRVQTDLPRETIRLAHAEGVIRTLAILDSMGYELVLVGPRIPKIVPRRVA